MITIPELRERLAQYIRERLADENVVVTTDYFPIVSVEDEQTAITIQPLSLSAIFADRMRYSVEPKISVTVSKRVGSNRQETGDEILVMGSKIIAAILGVGFAGVIVRSVEVSDPVLSEENISGQNMAVSRLVFSLVGYENKAS